jgi:hypothetical protein
MRKTLTGLIILLSLVLLQGCHADDPLPEDFYVTDMWGNDATFESITLTGQAAGKAPLTLEPGILLTTPEPGTLEYDGTGIYLTNTDHRRYISQAADSIIVPVTVANTIVETTVFTGVLNADELKTYRVYRLNLFGELSTASAADKITVTVYVNGTTLVTLESNAGVVTDAPFNGWVVFTVRSTGVAGEISSNSHLMLANKIINTNISSVAVDTTAINNLTLTFQWDAAKVDNIMTLDQAFLEVLD